MIESFGFFGFLWDVEQAFDTPFGEVDVIPFFGFFGLAAKETTEEGGHIDGGYDAFSFVFGGLSLVLDGLGNVGDGNSSLSAQVGNRAGDGQNTLHSVGR